MKSNPHTPALLISQSASSILLAISFVLILTGLGEPAAFAKPLASPYADTGLAAQTVQPDPCLRPANPIVAENCKPGTADWQIKKSLGDIEGYASLSSVSQSQPIDFYVNTSATSFDLSIYRSGYYQGKGGRLIQEVKGLSGGQQPACHSDPSSGLVSCSNWKSSYRMRVPEDWVSGVYLAKLTRPDTGGENFILFVVRDDRQPAEIYLQISVTTYQAYNFYGGKSVYTALSSNYCPTVADAARAVKVSFDRPSAIPVYFPNSYLWSDFPMVYWLEAQGYSVGYGTDLDTDRSGVAGRKNLLFDRKLFIALGHDEYWSGEMRQAVSAALDRGVNLAFFSSNVSYWRIHMEADPWSGQPDRVMVTYKTTESGGADPSGIPTTTWRDPSGANDPENSLVGIQYVGDNDTLFFPLRVYAEQGKDSIYRNTDLANLPAGTYAELGRHLVGWEWDAVTDNGRTPQNLVKLASSPAFGGILIDAGRKYQYGAAVANVSRYTAASGAKVFAAGTNQWAWGLALYEPNPQLQQITANLLADMGVYPVTPADSLVLDAPAQKAAAGKINYDAQGSIDPIPAIQGLLKFWGNVDFDSQPSSAKLPNPASSGEAGAAPVISNVRVEAGQDSVRVRWQTDQPTIGQIWIKSAPGPVDWKLSGRGLGARPIVSEALMESPTLDHELFLEDIPPGTQYYFHIAAANVAFKTTVSEEQAFQTATAGSLLSRSKQLLQPAYRQVRCMQPGQRAVVGGLGVLGGLGIAFALLAFLRVWSNRSH